jgi:hypothetical protein
MLLAALVVLNGELTSDMKLGDTATLGIVALVFAVLATASYSVATGFIIKGALAAKTAPMEESSSNDENEKKSDAKKSEDKPAEDSP